MLPKAYRLRRRGDFERVYREGRVVASAYLVMYFKRNGGQETRIGFTASRRLGKAVVRNRVKRLMREACRRQKDNLLPGYDIILIARERIKGIPYDLVEKEIKALFRRARLLRTHAG